MENIYNPPAFPGTDTVHPETFERFEPINQGISTRDYFATHANIEEDLSDAAYEAIMGEKAPIGRESLFERLKWHAEAEAKYRFMKADAMLAARMKPKKEE